MAIICKNYGDYNNAKQYYKTSLEYVTEEGKAGVIYNLANVYRNQKDYKKASDTYLEALDIAIEKNDVNIQIRIYHQLGVVYSALGDYEKSRAYYNSVISYANDSKVSRLFEGKSLHNIGDTYLQTGNYAEAIQYFQKALAFKTSARQKFVTLKDLGTCYLKQKDHLMAAQYLNEAKAHYQEVDQRPANIDLFKLLEETYRATNNSKAQNKSIDMFYAETTAYNEKRDLIVNQYSAAQLDIRIARFYENTSYADMIRKYQTMVYAGIAGLLVLVFLFVYLRKKEIRRKKYIAAEIANEMLLVIEKDS